MLHRSFKSAKCKTSLRLASSRIKLLKNKKQAAYWQQKKEVAQLLESGQERTARIRVEHVVREEKTMAAFELIEIYCELVIARLPIIESQKNCPIDLKEAITSLIFASPRCADIPELLDIRKHFTTKYGKDFVTSAIELRPDCGVNRMLVEKLSAVSPDGQTKLKILSAIAEEHNIKWDPNSISEPDAKPTEDRLNGPNTFQNTTKTYVEPPDVQAPPRGNIKHDVPENLNEVNRSSSLSSQSFASTDIHAGGRTNSSAHLEARPSRSRGQGMEHRQSSSEDGNNFSTGSQNWNMEFKDATSAAQAAAESAERASMAARAAAELSSRGKITRQYSNESQKSSGYGFRDEGRHHHTGSKLRGEHHAKSSVNNSFHGTNSPVHNEQIDGNEKDNPAGVAERFYSHPQKSSRSASRKSSIDSLDDGTLVNSPRKEDGYSKTSSSGVGVLRPNNDDLFGEGGVKEQSSKSEIDFSSEMQDGLETGNFDYSEAERLRKQSGSASSRSHSSTFSDDNDLVLDSNHNKFGTDLGENPFSVDQEKIQTDTREAHSDHNAAALVFDDSGSENENGKFSVEENYGRQESTFFASPDRNSLINSSTSIFGQNMSRSPANSILQTRLFTEPPEFFEGSTESKVPTEPDELMPVTFDDSDGPSSESEEELVKSKLGGTTQKSVYSGNPEPDWSDNHQLTGASFVEEKYSGSNRKPWSHSSSDDLDSVEVYHDRNQGTKFNAEPQKVFGFGASPPHQMSPRIGQSGMGSSDMDHKSFYSAFNEKKPQQSSKFSSVNEVESNVHRAETETETPHAMKDNEFTNQSSFDGAKELNLRGLTGGLRNKGYRVPPYSPSTDGSFSPKPVVEKTSATIEPSSAVGKMSSGAHNQKMSSKGDNRSNSKAQVSSSDSDTDDLKEEQLAQQIFRSNQEPSSQKAGTKVSKNIRSRMQGTYFDSDNGDFEEDYPQQSSTSQGRLGSGISRRTRSSPSQSEKSSYSKVKIASDGSQTSNHGAERKSSKSSHATKTVSPTRSQTVRLSSDHGSSKKSSSTEQVTLKPMPELKKPLREERLKTSAFEQTSSPLLKASASTSGSGSIGSSKPSSLSKNAPSRENSTKKASHVHPKLPDYDDLAAQLLSLRTNRK